MLIIGADYLATLLAQDHFSAKIVFNANGAIIFPTDQEHRDQKAPGISYADNSGGNALAAMLARGRIEIRRHDQFSDARVKETLRTLLAEPGLSPLQAWTMTYQGRELSLA